MTVQTTVEVPQLLGVAVEIPQVHFLEKFDTPVVCNDSSGVVAWVRPVLGQILTRPFCGRCLCCVECHSRPFFWTLSFARPLCVATDALGRCPRAVHRRLPRPTRTRSISCPISSMRKWRLHLPVFHDARAGNAVVHKLVDAMSSFCGFPG